LDHYKFHSQTLLTFWLGKQQCCQLCTSTRVYFASIIQAYYFIRKGFEHYYKANPIFSPIREMEDTERRRRELSRTV